MKTIVVARENALARARLRTVLRAAGYGVTVAAGGRDALAAMLLQPPDVALVDLQLPDLDGVGVVQAMRADARLWAVPAVALSGVDRARDREYALAAGFNGYLRRPVARARLLAEVRRWAG
jgi:two-component system cell cycle response regulator DivK